MAPSSSSSSSSSLEPRLGLDLAADRGPLIIIVVTSLMLISTLSVSLRIYTRKFLLDKFGFDDFLVICALLATLGDGVAVIFNTRYGAGKHIGAFDEALIPLYFRAFYVSIVLYMVALLFLKTTFLAQYYRVFFAQKGRPFFFAVAFVVCGWGVSQVFVGIFLCYPIQGFWDKTVDARCIPTNLQWHVNAAGNIATDIIVFVLPLPVIGQLNLPKTQKLLLIALFSLGFLQVHPLPNRRLAVSLTYPSSTVAISVVRIQYLKLFEDVTWENVAPACWSIAELTTALIVASLSTIRPFMSRHFPGLISSHRSARRSSYLRHGDSESRPGGAHGGVHKAAWLSDKLVSLDSAADKREHARLARQHGFELSTQPSQDSVREMAVLWPQHHEDPQLDLAVASAAARRQAEYARVVALHSTTTTEVRCAAQQPNDPSRPKSQTPSGPYILVQHDVHQTKRPL
jgi:hypothetical protein